MHQRFIRLAAFIFIFSGSTVNGSVFPLFHIVEMGMKEKQQQQQQVKVIQAEGNR